MTKFPGLTHLIEQAVITANDDLRPGLAGIRFDVERLASVVQAVTDPDRLNAAVATCREQLDMWIRTAAEAEDMEMFGHARAALALEEKLTAPRHRGYRPDGNGGFTPII